jgi:Flp pilus assembly protein TadG
MLTLVFGLIDFSQMIFVKQVMSGITRQGSNLASRGTSLAETVTALSLQGGSLNIGTDGRIIVTAVADVKGKPEIMNQSETPNGISVTSAIGSVIGKPATMPASANTALSAGQTLYVTEVFYSYSPMTPIGNLLRKSVGSILYETAIF